MHVQDKVLRVIDLLVTNSNQNTSTSFLHLLVENTVEHWVNLLNILDQQGQPKPNGRLKVLHETIISKTCLLNLLSCVMIHHELESLIRRIDDQWVPVEALDDDHVFDAE